MEQMVTIAINTEAKADPVLVISNATTGNILVPQWMMVELDEADRSLKLAQTRIMLYVNYHYHVPTVKRWLEQRQG